MKSKFLLLSLFFSLVLLSGAFAKEKSMLPGKWKTDTFQLKIDKDTIKYTDIKTDKTIEWEYTAEGQIPDKGSFTITKEKECNLADKANDLDYRFYNHLYRNNRPILWEVKDECLFLTINSEIIKLEDAHLLSKDEKKTLLKTAGAIAAVAVTAYEIDVHYFSESELKSLTNQAVSDAKDLK